MSRRKSIMGNCQEGRCRNKAKYRSPSGLQVCGVHRRTIDAYYERLQEPKRCVPLVRIVLKSVTYTSKS